MVRLVLVFGVVDAEDVEEDAAGSQAYDLGREGGPDGDEAQHPADEVSDGAGHVLDGGIDGKVGALLFGAAGVDDVVGGGGVHGGDEDAREGPSADDHGFIDGGPEDRLTAGISQGADQHEPLGGHVAAHLAPEGREQEVHGHHGSQRHAEHGTVQVPFYDQRRSDRMGEAGRGAQEHHYHEKDQSLVVFKAFLFSHLRRILSAPQGPGTHAAKAPRPLCRRRIFYSPQAFLVNKRDKQRQTKWPRCAKRPDARNVPAALQWVFLDGSIQLVPILSSPVLIL